MGIAVLSLLGALLSVILTWRFVIWELSKGSGVEGGMGLQANLCQMLGLPETFPCPSCGAVAQTNFDDYDIDDHPYQAGEWELFLHCDECETGFRATATVQSSLSLRGGET